MVQHIVWPSGVIWSEPSETGINPENLRGNRVFAEYH